jgi:YfiH family protein
VALSTDFSASEPNFAELLRAPALVSHAHVRHGFTTRHGGVSAGPWGPLTLAPHPGQSSLDLAENWRIALHALGGPGPDRLALLQQVHGARVVEVGAPAGPADVVAAADGAWTAQPNLVLAVRTADCVPILFSAPGAVGVAHAGWRGIAAGVVAATVEAICAGVDCLPTAVVAVVGPCISGAAYEVGPEVLAALVASGLSEAQVLARSDGPRPHVDLGQAVLAQLAAHDVVDASRIHGCTFSEDRFHSHRRDGGNSGRLAGLIVRCA